MQKKKTDFLNLKKDLSICLTALDNIRDLEMDINKLGDESFAYKYLLIGCIEVAKNALQDSKCKLKLK